MTSPLRVLSVLTTDSSGGAEFAAVDLLDALARRDVRTRLLTNRPALVEGTAVSTAPIELGPKLARRTARSTVVAAPSSRRTLRRRLAEERDAAAPEVLLLHFKKEQLLVSSLPRRTTPPIVWAEWGPLPGPLRHGAGRQVYVAAARRAASILAESDRTRDSLLEAGVPASKVVVAGNVFDGERIAFDADGRVRFRRLLDVPDDGFVVVCVSRLNRTKHLETVVDAMGALTDEVRLVLAGDGDHAEALRRRAAPFGGRVRFLPVPRGHVPQLLSAADVQVYSPSDAEGAARAVTLGQLTGRPVISTATEGVRGLIVPGAGAILGARDPEELAACIRAYQQDPARREREGRQSRERAIARLVAADPVGSVHRVLLAAAGAGT